MSYASVVDRSLAKRWLAGHEAVRRRNLAVMRERGAPAPEVAFSQAMELVDLSPAEDPFRDADVARARAAWAKLRGWAASRARR